MAYRYFFIRPGQKRDESASELNQRYLQGALETGCRALAASFKSAQVSARRHRPARGVHLNGVRLPGSRNSTGCPHGLPK